MTREKELSLIQRTCSTHRAVPVNAGTAPPLPAVRYPSRENGERPPVLQSSPNLEGAIRTAGDYICTPWSITSETKLTKVGLLARTRAKKKAVKYDVYDRGKDINPVALDRDLTHKRLL